MTEQKNSVGMDPAKLWSQWYETSSKMWSNVMGGAMNGGQEVAMDPHSLYRQWFSGMEQMRDRMMYAPGMAAGTMPQASQVGVGEHGKRSLEKLVEQVAGGFGPGLAEDGSDWHGNGGHDAALDPGHGAGAGTT